MKNIKRLAILNILIFVIITIFTFLVEGFFDELWGFYFIPVLISVFLSIVSIYKRTGWVSFILSSIPFFIWLSIIMLLIIYKPTFGTGGAI